MPEPFRVIALLAAYNEGDVIGPVVSRLVENGVDVYLIDNRSTDDTVVEARRTAGKGLVGIESFPADQGGAVEQPESFAWSRILSRKEELARELQADWFIHHDADEIRESPWPGVSLRDGIQWVDRLGYNAIDFALFNFRPVDDGFRPGADPRDHFRYYEPGADFDRVQVKCWKASPNVGLVRSGGHDVELPGRRVFPIQFLLLHYPIRGQRHGERKVFEERKGRFSDNEVGRGWHVQYRDVDPGHRFLRDPLELKRFDLDQVRLEVQLGPDGIVDLRSKLREVEERLARSEAEGAVRLSNAQLAHEETVAQYRQALTEAREHHQAADAAFRKEISELVQRLKEREEQHRQVAEALQERIGTVQALESHVRADLERRVGIAEAAIADASRRDAELAHLRSRLESLERAVRDRTTRAGLLRALLRGT